jgi:hypothetical protein
LDDAEEEEEAKIMEEAGGAEWEEDYSNNRTIIYNIMEGVPQI